MRKICVRLNSALTNYSEASSPLARGFRNGKIVDERQEGPRLVIRPQGENVFPCPQYSSNKVYLSALMRSGMSRPALLRPAAEFPAPRWWRGRRAPLSTDLHAFWYVGLPTANFWNFAADDSIHKTTKTTSNQFLDFRGNLCVPR